MKLKDKVKCPICSRGVETILNKVNKVVFQKHIGIGFRGYGQSRGNICFSSFKDITRTKEDIKDSFQKEQIFWNSEIKRINKLKEERI